eukprot:Skav205826  [mRNA]  locus=scaffold870:87919:88344:+ [translate_table: standard]
MEESLGAAGPWGWLPTGNPASVALTVMDHGDWLGTPMVHVMFASLVLLGWCLAGWWVKQERAAWFDCETPFLGVGDCIGWVHVGLRKRVVDDEKASFYHVRNKHAWRVLPVHCSAVPLNRRIHDVRWLVSQVMIGYSWKNW